MDVQLAVRWIKLSIIANFSFIWLYLVQENFDEKITEIEQDVNEIDVNLDQIDTKIEQTNEFLREINSTLNFDFPSSKTCRHKGETRNWMRQSDNGIYVKGKSNVMSESIESIKI